MLVSFVVVEGRVRVRFTLVCMSNCHGIKDRVRCVLFIVIHEMAPNTIAMPRNAAYVITALLLWYESFGLAENNIKGFTAHAHCLRRETLNDTIGLMLSVLSLILFAAFRARDGHKFDLKKGLERIGTNSLERFFSLLKGHGGANRGPTSKKLSGQDYMTRCAFICARCSDVIVTCALSYQRAHFAAFENWGESQHTGERHSKKSC